MIANYTNHAANERTFLAWIRTVAAFGFFLIKLNVFVDAVGGGSIPPPSGARPRRLSRSRPDMPDWQWLLLELPSSPEAASPLSAPAAL
jgi:hypothetical protein